MTAEFETLTPKVTTQDGYSLNVACFRPKDTQPQKTIVIAPAMGAVQRFYQPFAQWLAQEHGCQTVCFDYRGLEPNPAPMKDQRHSILTWIEQDAEAVLQYADSIRDKSELIWSGHSLGCQILGGMPSRHKVDRMAGIATGTGYWGRGDLALMPKAALLWLVLVPLLTPAAGYFPGKRIGVVADLPKEVIWQWRSWCLNRDYLTGVEKHLREQYSQFSIQADILTFTDDELMSRGNSEDLYRLYPAAQGQHHRISPAEAGVDSIGHFGFFKTKNAQKLWPLAWSRLFEQQETHA